MVALSATVFTLSWWMGLFLAARDPRKPALVLAAVGRCGWAAVGALAAVRVTRPARAEALARIELYRVALPGVAWFAVVLELARPADSWGDRRREMALTGIVAVLVLIGATLAGNVDGPLRMGHWLMVVVISVSTLAAMVFAARRAAHGGNDWRP